MKPTAVLVNTSRGPVVDQAALADALTDGSIWAAALDVTDPEPIPMDDRLVGLDNCLIVPHIASASRATRGKMAQMAAANLIAGVTGQPLPTEVPAAGLTARRCAEPVETSRARSSYRRGPRGCDGGTLMPDVVDAALENQRRNIETRTGRSFDDWLALARASGHEKHGALLAWLKTEHGVSHGDANRIALDARRSEPAAGAGAAADELDAIYAGPKAALRPLHERVVSLAPDSAMTSACRPSRPTSRCVGRSSSRRSDRRPAAGWRSV